MLLKELYKIADLGSQQPLSFWLPEYKRIKQNVLPLTQEILSQLHETETKKTWQKFTKILQEEPEEKALAENLMNIAFFLETERPKEERTLLENKFIEKAKKFLKLVRAIEIFKLKRAKLKKKLSPQQQKEHDQKIFRHEGMMYCLEYYLQIYKMLKDTKEPEQKKKIIEQEEVNIGSGPVPGLWNDFKQTDVLEKFIYLVLDDSSRELLTQAYFSVRKQFLKIKTTNQLTNESAFTYQECSLEKALENFRLLIEIFIKIFQNNGFEKLSSDFLTPYGYQPQLSEIKL